MPNLSWFFFVIGLLLVIIGLAFHLNSHNDAFLASVLFVLWIPGWSMLIMAWVGFCRIWTPKPDLGRRCRHCGRVLGEFHGERCPQCGEELCVRQESDSGDCI